MHLINRAVAVIKPRQRYFDWTRSLPDVLDELTLADLQRDCTTILIPEFDSLRESEAFIADMATHLFEIELDAWDHDTRTWPTNRDSHTFREWFDVEIHSMVLDAADEDITREAI